MTDLASILRGHATDWNGEQMPDLEPAKGDPTAGLMRAAAGMIENLSARLTTLARDLKQPLVKYQRARHYDEWTEVNGDVLWWNWPITEPPHCGTPLDSDWPVFYHSETVKWTPLIVPDSLA